MKSRNLSKTSAFRAVLTKKTSKITLSVAFVMLLYIGFSFFKKPLDNATIQLGKFDFSEDICGEDISHLTKNLKGVDGVKSVLFLKESKSLVAAYDNRFLTTSAIEAKVSESFSGAYRVVLGQDFPNARRCPIHKSRFLSYVFNFF